MAVIHSKEGIVFLVQIDHIQGEIIGSVIEQLYLAGALNVQVISTVTKKNRPGYIFIIDLPSERTDAIERVIVRELGSTGWHKLLTDHRHVPVEKVFKDVKVIFDSYEFLFSLEGKQIKGQPESVRPEHINYVALRDKIKHISGVDISLLKIYKKVQIALLQEENIINLKGEY